MKRAALALVVLAGCTKPEAPPRTLPPPTALEPCGPPSTTKLGAIKLKLWRGEGVAIREALALAQEIEDVWGPLGLTVEVDPTPGSMRFETAIDDGDDPARALRHMRAYLKRADVRYLHLAAVKEIVDPASPLRATLGEVHGLTLLKEDPLPGLDLSRFPPMMLVRVQELRTPRPGARRFTAAHELGHALGLEHVADRKNLMQTGWFECLPNLRPEQSDKVRQQLSLPTKG